jgi:hypothetical protein
LSIWLGVEETEQQTENVISDRADEVHGQRGGDFGNLRIFMADSGNFKNFVHMFFFFGDLVSHQGPVDRLRGLPV